MGNFFNLPGETDDDIFSICDKVGLNSFLTAAFQSISA